MELCLENLKAEVSFDRDMLFHEMERYDPSISESAFKKKLQSFLKNGSVIRVGRNAYSVPQQGQTAYAHEYSSLAIEVADQLKTDYPLLDFRIFESIQLNDFVNHQIAHNVVYLSIENGLGDFVFGDFREKYPGKVLLHPGVKVFQQYWQDNMLVIEKLPTEAPRGKAAFWHTELEKMLVDIMADKLVMESVIESEYPAIYEEAFSRYIVDESQMFRYAKRRTADKRIRNFLKENTAVILRAQKSI